jgi:hypothetical protein
MYKQPPPVFSPRSLNIIVRRKENLRIEKENEAIAQRLFAKASCFKKSEFDRSFAEAQSHRNRIQRVKPVKLKPLTETEVAKHKKRFRK